MTAVVHRVKHASVAIGDKIAGKKYTRRFWIISGVFILALILRLIYLYESSDSPTYNLPIVDSLSYDKLARSLVKGGELDENYFWQPFVYPMFLSLVYSLSSFSIIAVKIIQAIIGSFTCVLTYMLGEAIYDRRTGIMAALTTVFYGPLIFFDGELLASGMAGFLSVALILLFMKSKKIKSTWLFLLLGATGAVSILTRPTFLLFFLAGCLWLTIVLFSDGGWSWKFAINILVLMAGFISVTAPVAMLNFKINHHFTVLPSSGGINLYIGNNPEYCETMNTRPGWEWEELTGLPRRYGATDNWEASEIFLNRVKDYVLTRPFSFLSGLVHKTVRFVSSREIPRNFDIYVFRKWSATLKILLWKVGGFGFPFGIVFPFAILGLFSSWRRISMPMAIFLLLYPASIILVFVTGRYRIPVIPILSVAAALGCLWLFDEFSNRRIYNKVMPIAVFSAAVFISFLPGPFCEEKFNNEAELYSIIGYTAHLSGHSEKALTYLYEALRINPEFPDALKNIGTVMSEMGEYDKAVAYLERALELKPDFAEAKNSLGVTLAGKGLYKQAIMQYKDAIGINPYVARVYNNLGIAQSAMGKTDEALNSYRRALGLDPRYANAHVSMANTFLKEGEIGESIRHYREALRLEPDLREALNNLAWVLANNEDSRFRNPNEAVTLAIRACELSEYKEYLLLDTLAVAYAESGRLAEAINMGQKAINLARGSAADVEVIEEMENRLQRFKSGF